MQWIGRPGLIAAALLAAYLVGSLLVSVTRWYRRFRNRRAILLRCQVIHGARNWTFNLDTTGVGPLSPDAFKTPLKRGLASKAAEYLAGPDYSYEGIERPSRLNAISFPFSVDSLRSLLTWLLGESPPEEIVVVNVFEASNSLLMFLAKRSGMARAACGWQALTSTQISTAINPRQNYATRSS